MNLFELQPTHLQNEIVQILPLKPSDFDELYNVANDPLIWEQHPNKDRYKKEVFETYFEGAILSKGAFLIKDIKLDVAIGSSRFYDLNEQESSILIGYTFFAKSYWGGNYNKAVKRLMLHHAFKFVNNVCFHIGANNIRSQKAIERIGAKKIDEQLIAYHGEPEKLNFIYQIKKVDFNY